MKNYNYLETMKEDIKAYLEDNMEYKYCTCADSEELEQMLYDDLFCEDSITGNASGSYTFNRYEAKENVLDNTDLLSDMCAEFGIDAETIGKKFLSDEWEWMDVSIRCYLLSQAIAEVLEEIAEDLEQYFAENEE